MSEPDDPWQIAQPMKPLAFAAEGDSNGSLSVEARICMLFEACRQPVFNYAISIGATPAVAEEVVQEGFLRLFNELNRGRRLDRVRGWLFRVVRNLVIDRSRTLSREMPLDDFNFEQLCGQRVDPNPTPEQALLDQERLKRLHEDLKRLTAHQREALFLRAEGFRHREIAEIMSLARSTVTDLLRRAVARLAQKPGPQG